MQISQQDINELQSAAKEYYSTLVYNWSAKFHIGIDNYDSNIEVVKQLLLALNYKIYIGDYTSLDTRCIYLSLLLKIRYIKSYIPPIMRVSVFTMTFPITFGETTITNPNYIFPILIPIQLS